MLAPIDKYKNGGNDIVQIVVTTRCDRACSNCTQLLPFRKDYAFMSPECFDEACASVADWPGLIAMFGGNPCVHPKFPELCEIMAARIAPEHRGLWTNNLFKHGEIASKTFGRGVGRFNRGGLNLNAHADAAAFEAMDKWFPGQVIARSRNTPAMHASILIDHTDFGITPDHWFMLRENCDINKNWSGAIVERDGKPYAYFCEVAAAIDGVLGLNRGIPAAPGWWKSGMGAFNAQLAACERCGVPLRDDGARDVDEVYNVSGSWRARLPDDKARLAAPRGTKNRKVTTYV